MWCRCQLEKDTTITLNKDNLVIDLSISKTEKLVATTNSQKSLIWNSSNIDVATVSDDGTITGLKTEQQQLRQLLMME